MTIKLAVIMDPVTTVAYHKDSTLAMLFAAKEKGWSIHYLLQHDLFLEDGKAFAGACPMTVSENPTAWYQLGDKQIHPLTDFDIILMRKDPPFNENYIYTTYILEQAERDGVLVANKPQSLRDANEKLFATLYPDLCPPTLVTQCRTQLHAFLQAQKDIVCKPLNTMGGTSVFRVTTNDPNINVIFETLTHQGKEFIMAQRYIPEITAGDKRIILIDGEPIPHALARVPQAGDWRGNLVAGAKGEVHPLTARDKEICARLKPILIEKGLYFVGIDVIGDYLTEVNVTSPTGIREIDKATGTNIASLFLDKLTQKL